MKTTLLSIIFCLLLQISHSQTACDLLSQGAEKYEKQEFDSAIAKWQQATQLFKDTAACIGSCYYNIGIAYEQQKNVAKAVAAYHKVLTAQLNNEDNGDNLMEPYANYHHNACMRLYMLMKEQKQYDKALEYLKWAETTYPYETFSNTSFEKRAVSIAYRKMDLYESKEQIDSAIYVGVQKVLDRDVFFRKPDASSFTNVDFYSQLAKDTRELISKKYDLQAFLVELQQSFGTISIEKTQIKAPKKDLEGVIGTFQFKEKTYRIGVLSNNFDKDKFLKYLNNSSLFDK